MRDNSFFQTYLTHFDVAREYPNVGLLVIWFFSKNQKPMFFFIKTKKKLVFIRFFFGLNWF